MLYSLTHVILQINPKSFIQENNYRLTKKKTEWRLKKEKKIGCGEVKMGVVEIMLTPTVSPSTSPLFLQLSSPLLCSPPIFHLFLIFPPNLSLRFLFLSVIPIGEHSLILIQSIDFYSSLHSLGL